MAISPQLIEEEICNVLQQLENEKYVLSASVAVLPLKNVDCVTDEENMNDDETEDPQLVEVAGNLELHIQKDYVDDDENNINTERNPCAGSSKNLGLDSISVN